jgi:hypothetical protein
MAQVATRYPSLEANCIQEVKLCIDIGLTCVSTIPKERPYIGEIVNKINGRNKSSSTN